MNLSIRFEGPHSMRVDKSTEKQDISSIYFSMEEMFPLEIIDLAKISFALKSLNLILKLRCI